MGKREPADLRSTNEIVDRIQRSRGIVSTGLTIAVAHIRALERRLKEQSKLEDKIRQLEGAALKHAERLAERNRAVGTANDELHQQRLENVKCKREITHLKASLRELGHEHE